MDQRPAISVALPTCNGARHIGEALGSIFHQQGGDFDLVISDDRSEDETLAIVRELVGDRARVSVNPERLGLAGNWNRCVELSRCEWVAIFHQDDVMLPGHLAGHLKLIDIDPAARIGLIAGPVEMIDDSGEPVRASVVHPGGLVFNRPVDSTEIVLQPGALLEFLSAGNPLRCSAVTLRKATHEAVGGFDPAFRYAVDWDFWIRVGRDWGLAWSLEPPSVRMRWHLASETHRFKTGTADLDEQIRVLDRLHQNESPGRFRRDAADRRLARAFLNRAHVALKAGDLVLARNCLGRSIEHSRSVLWTIASDPRLAVQMATLSLAPQRAMRWFGPRG